MVVIDLKKIQVLNDKLERAEERIYNLAKAQNQIVIKKILEKEQGIIDYELEIELFFYINEEELISFNEYIKPHFLKDTPCNINDKKNHNVTRGIYDNPELNSQKHCWLMHSLYDDYYVPWEDICKITLLSFDINIRYQYEVLIDMEAIKN